MHIVFNSSASYMGQKLNEFWAKGSNILNNLLGVLFRFRQEKLYINVSHHQNQNAGSTHSQVLVERYGQQ